jgi:hypothetical protein
MKKVKLSGSGCFFSDIEIKSKNDLLFIKKQIFHHKLLDRQLSVAKTLRARSAEHIFSRCSDDIDKMNSSKQRVLSNNQNLVVCLSARPASTRNASLRAEFCNGLTRSKSLNELSELKKQHNITLQWCAKSTVIENPAGYYNKKKSNKALNVLRSSMQIKRNKQYTKAVLVVIGSSLCFLFLHLLMIWSKVYNLAYPEHSEAAQKASDLDHSFVNDTDVIPSSLNQSYKLSESLFFTEIGLRFARYFYYLTFVSNVFFFTLKNPTQGRQNPTIKVKSLAVKLHTRRVQK